MAVGGGGRFWKRAVRSRKITSNWMGVRSRQPSIGHLFLWKVTKCKWVQKYTLVQKQTRQNIYDVTRKLKYFSISLYIWDNSANIKRNWNIFHWPTKEEKIRKEVQRKKKRIWASIHLLLLCPAPCKTQNSKLKKRYGSPFFPQIHSKASSSKAG